MKQLRFTLIFATVSVLLLGWLINCSSEVSAYKRLHSYKFSEKERLVKKEDGGFDFSTDICDVIRLDLVSGCIDSVMILDINKANSIWESRGDTISENYNGRRMIIIDQSNLPSEYDFVISPEFDSIRSKLISCRFTERPNEAKWQKPANKFLKKERNYVNVDYAISNDSLIICVYHSVFDMSGKHGKKRQLDHINFIHKYRCDKNEWELANINDTEDYFPGYYKTDILRSFTDEDLKAFINTYYQHRRWREMRLFNRAFSRSDLYKETYIKNSDFPIGALDGITDSLYRLPNNFEYLKIKKKKPLLKTPKSVICAEYKLKGDSLIISFFDQKYFLDDKVGLRTIYGDLGNLGYYTYKYDCDTHKWKKISEYFILKRDD